MTNERKSQPLWRNIFRQQGRGGRAGASRSHAGASRGRAWWQGRVGISADAPGRHDQQGRVGICAASQGRHGQQGGLTG